MGGDGGSFRRWGLGGGPRVLGGLSLKRVMGSRSLLILLDFLVHEGMYFDSHALPSPATLILPESQSIGDNPSQARTLKPCME